MSRADDLDVASELDREGREARDAGQLEPGPDHPGGLLVDLTSSTGGSLGEGGGLALWRSGDELLVEVIDGDSYEQAVLDRDGARALHEALGGWLA